jgi:cytochrome c553
MTRTRLLVLLVLIALVRLTGSTTAGPLDQPGYAKAFTCSACHGFAGHSKTDTVPILAGADAAYLKKALEDYAAGRRPSPEMEPYAKMAVHLGVAEVAGYFAVQPRTRTPLAVDAAAAARGKTVATACAACHGTSGQGDPAKLVPRLAGQPAGYLANQIMLFKQDRRSPGDEAVTAMKAMMRSVPDGAVGDLAAYYSSLP